MAEFVARQRLGSRRVGDQRPRAVRLAPENHHRAAIVGSRFTTSIRLDQRVRAEEVAEIFRCLDLL